MAHFEKVRAIGDLAARQALHLEVIELVGAENDLHPLDVHMGPAEGMARIDEEMVRAVGAWLMDQRRPVPAPALVQEARAEVLGLCEELGDRLRNPRGPDAVWQSECEALGNALRDALDIILEKEGT